MKNESLSLELHLDKSKFKNHESIQIKLELKNKSKEIVSIDLISFFANLSPLVIDVKTKKQYLLTSPGLPPINYKPQYENLVQQKTFMIEDLNSYLTEKLQVGHYKVKFFYNWVLPDFIQNISSNEILIEIY